MTAAASIWADGIVVLLWKMHYYWWYGLGKFPTAIVVQALVACNHITNLLMMFPVAKQFCRTIHFCVEPCFFVSQLSVFDMLSFSCWLHVFLQTWSHVHQIWVLVPAGILWYWTWWYFACQGPKFRDQNMTCFEYISRLSWISIPYLTITLVFSAILTVCVSRWCHYIPTALN